MKTLTHTACAVKQAVGDVLDMLQELAARVEEGAPRTELAAKAFPSTPSFDQILANPKPETRNPLSVVRAIDMFLSQARESRARVLSQEKTRLTAERAAADRLHSAQRDVVFTPQQTQLNAYADLHFLYLLYGTDTRVPIYKNSCISSCM